MIRSRVRRACSRRWADSYRRFVLTRPVDAPIVILILVHWNQVGRDQGGWMASIDEPLALVDRLVQATNDHDLDGLVACFAADYENATPAHPARSFRGREQVRRNW